MSQRFTDREKWTNNKWFRQLPPTYKLFWLYLCDLCNNVGIWYEDIDQASFHLGVEIDRKEALRLFNGRVALLQNRKGDEIKWWLRDFCNFQYGVLKENTNNKAHQSYIKLLKKHGLWGQKDGACMPPIGGMDGAQEKEKEKEKEKDKEKDKEKEKEKEKEKNTKGAYEKRFDMFWELYPKKVAKAKTKTKWLSLKPDENLFNEIMKGLLFYIQSEQWQKDNGQFIPHPTTFLNQERWKDDIGVKLPRSQIPTCPGCGKSLENELRNRAGHCYNSDCDTDISSITYKPP